MGQPEAHEEKAKVAWKTLNFTLILSLFIGILLIAVAVILGIYFWPLHPKPLEILREPPSPSAYTNTEKTQSREHTSTDSAIVLKTDYSETKTIEVVTNRPDTTISTESSASTEKSFSNGYPNQKDGNMIDSVYRNNKEQQGTTNSNDQEEVTTSIGKTDVEHSSLPTVDQLETTTFTPRTINYENNFNLDMTTESALSTERTTEKDGRNMRPEGNKIQSNADDVISSASPAAIIESLNTVTYSTNDPFGTSTQTSTPAEKLDDFDSEFSKLVQLFGINPLESGPQMIKPGITHHWPNVMDVSTSASGLPRFPPLPRIADSPVSGFINSVFKQVDDQFREIERMFPPKSLFFPFQVPLLRGF